jgi:DNA-directed RNA polymerase subunit H
MRFNVLEHRLVPEHHLLSQEQAETVLKQLGVARDQLPKILRSDRVIQLLEHVHGPIASGRLIKVVRHSPTAGYAVAYRVVREGR